RRDSPQQPQQQQRPEAVVFASFYNASRRQPLLLASLADGAEQERTTPRPRPLLPAEATRHCSQASGSAAEASGSSAAATPAWQLIRPRPRRRPTVPLSDPPRRSGSDNDSDDGERAEAPRMMQRRLRQFEPLRSSPRRPSQSPDIFAESPLNQTRIVESADCEVETTRARIRLPAAFPAASSPPPAASSPPRRHHSRQPAVEKTVTLQVPQQRTRKTSRGSATEKPAVSCQVVADSTRRSKRLPNLRAETTRCQTLTKATTETKEQQAAAAHGNSVGRRSSRVEKLIAAFKIGARARLFLLVDVAGAERKSF
uniref:Kinesin motor domain-containing protein n=1 Tax=Macrostomum lignano TaxID=282301 RepID=A0A1I8FCQ1_9PLAT